MTVGVAALTTLIVVAAGLLLDRALSSDGARPADERAVAVLGLGITATGIACLALGDVRLLYRPTFWVAGLAAVVVIVLMRATLREVVVRAVAAVRRDWREILLPGLATIATYVVSVDLALRAPLGGDEGDYKWTTPLTYAIHHRVTRVDVRLSNGIYLSELLVVPAAVFRSLHAARLVQLLAVVLLALAARVVARRFGGSGNFAAFAVLGALVVATYSIAVGSDVLVAALLTAALALLLRGDRRGLLAAGIVLAGAVTTKQYTALLVPIFLVLALLLDVGAEGVAWRPASAWRPRVGAVVTRLVLPAVLVLVLGIVQTWVLVGRPLDHYGLGIYPANDPHVLDGRAAGRIPELRDIVLLPAVPAFVGVHGGEPYGRRAGLVLPLACAAVVAGLILGDRRWRRRLLLSAVLAAASFLLVAPVFVKTRFLIFTWVLVFVAADVAVASRRSLGTRREGVLTAIAAQLVLLVGFADSLRWLLERYWWSRIF
ncbi:MAG: hypothetical protein ACXVJ7_05520 [Acidimicrobiia bacterium]